MLLLGPKTLPFIGNLISVALDLRSLKYHHAVWREWSRKYGDVIGLRLGFLRVVIVSGKDLIKEVSSREEFEGRPNGFYYLLRQFGKKYGKQISFVSFWSIDYNFFFIRVKGCCILMDSQVTWNFCTIHDVTTGFLQ